MKATLEIRGYLAVIPKIQNIYPIERVETGWQTGFKYDSGVFEFFTYKSKIEAESAYHRIRKSVDDYYKKKEI